MVVRNVKMLVLLFKMVLRNVNRQGCGLEKGGHCFIAKLSSPTYLLVEEHGASLREPKFAEEHGASFLKPNLGTKMS